MLEFIAGIISGILSGIGIGGGTVLILLLSAFLGIEQHTSQATNLVFFVPASLASIFLNFKEKLINWRLGISIASFGIIGAIIGAKISTKMNVQVLKKYFGIFLIIVAIYEIYTLLKNKKKLKRSNLL